MGFLSKLFGKNDTQEEKAFKKILKLIENEHYQNSLLPKLIQSEIINGVSVDKLPGATGRFGFEENNPIPVNGPLGELTYMSQLETNEGERLLFHRIGSRNKIDIFEAVTFSGSSWHRFFLDFYHPRRSKLAPEGFRLGEPKQFSGFHNFCSNFPYDFLESKKAERESGLSFAYIPLSAILPQINSQAFHRPDEHVEKPKT